MYISRGEANTKVPEHSHDEGDGIRFIMDGSMVYEGIELEQGDWMFLRAGPRYAFEVGPRGVLMCYCYSCCCA